MEFMLAKCSRHFLDVSRICFTVATWWWV